ncbi:MAG: hypothetical protein KUA38_08600 [Hydrogenophaga sp.]|nr:hypothetical protein [Hydrogenophaga sp.]
MQPLQLEPSQENNRQIMGLAEVLKMMGALYEYLGDRKTPAATWFYFETKSFLRYPDRPLEQRVGPGSCPVPGRLVLR